MKTKIIVKKHFIAFIGMMVLTLTSAEAQIPLMEIVAASAPNPIRSPNSGSWKTAAASWLETKNGAGDPTVNPAAFAPLAVIAAGDLMVVPPDSQTHLWKAVINPTGALTSLEFGNRLAFVFSIRSSTPFRMSNIRTTLTASDSRLNATEMLSPYVYNSYTIGLNYGADGVKGGGDDTRPGNGASATTLVNELYYGGGIILGAYGVRNTQDGVTIESYVGNQTPPFYAMLKVELLDDTGNVIAIATKKIATVPIVPVQPAVAMYALPGGTLSLSLTGEAERTYTIQVAPAIRGSAATSGWMDAATLYAGPTGSIGVTITPKTGTMGYFRIAVPQ